MEIMIQFSTAGVVESKNYPVVFKKNPQKLNGKQRFIYKTSF